ncbi:MAG: glycosyltransferase [Gemmatimonadetes bacterium]|nr:glycosyltransferase [Gemmatimonadota bacterium]
MISFVVPAYNEEPLIEGTLSAIREAAGALDEPFETIVADDASTDGTVERSRAAGAAIVEVAYRQIAATRNAGAAASGGDRLIFVDADTLVNPPVVVAARDALADGAIGGGARVRFDGAVPLYARAGAAWLNFSFGLARLAAGCFIFCRRDAFDTVGGFDERYYGAEEIWLSRALKRHGRFVMLREGVLTSGRKVRAHSPWEIGRITAGLLLGGPRAARKRSTFDIWYDGRREDPDPSR